MTPPSTLRELVDIILNIINPLLLVIAGLSLLAFFKGLISFIFHAGDAKGNDEGKSLMKWGLIALFVMVTLWGILSFFSNSFGFGPRVILPLLPVPNH